MANINYVQFGQKLYNIKLECERKIKQYGCEALAKMDMPYPTLTMYKTVAEKCNAVAFKKAKTIARRLSVEFGIELTAEDCVALITAKQLMRAYENYIKRGYVTGTAKVDLHTKALGNPINAPTPIYYRQESEYNQHCKYMSVKAYLSGMSMKEIHEKTGIGTANLYVLLHELESTGKVGSRKLFKATEFFTTDICNARRIGIKMLKQEKMTSCSAGRKMKLITRHEHAHIYVVCKDACKIKVIK